MKKLVLTSVCALAVSGAAFAQGLVDWATAPGSFFIVQTNATTYSPLFGGGATGGGTLGNEGPGATGAGFYETLLYGSQNTTGVQLATPNSLNGLLTGWFGTGLYATNALAATYNGRLGFINPNGSAVLPWGGNSDAGGKSNNIVMVGWSANLGGDWLTVSNNLANWATVQGSIVGPAFFGVSATGYIVGNDAPALGAALFGSAPNSFTGNGLLLSQSATGSNQQQLFLLPVSGIPEPGTLALAGLGGLSLLLFRRQRK